MHFPLQGGNTAIAAGIALYSMPQASEHLWQVCAWMLQELAMVASVSRVAIIGTANRYPVTGTTSGHAKRPLVGNPGATLSFSYSIRYS